MKFAKNIQTHLRAGHGGPYSIKNPNPKILDFSSNVNPLGFPGVVKKSLNLAKVSTYPDHDSTKLKQKLAKYLKISTDYIIVGNGATEIIYDFCRATINRTKVLIVVPTFSEYESASCLCGAKPQFFISMDLQADLEKFMQKIPRNGMVFLCNPNNPTGKLIPKHIILQIIKSAKAKSSIVFVDECFMELAVPQNQSVIDLVPKHDNLFVLRSLTKSFGLAGLRIGYGVGSKALVSVLDRIKIPWSVNGLAQEAGIAALDDVQFLAKTQRLIKKESKFLINSISGIDGFSCHDTDTNFILIKTRQPAKTLQKKLLHQNVLVRDCSNFRGLDNHHIRIAVRTHKENQKLVSALERIQ
ncbi:threonine-phosphate decarboxylase CobD [Candidatus Nitrosotenuis cloacae]|uniref:threonine-phosphate decarboxylase n=1 Tax=Candidatus Nitrosotenuis cloacae TaxID=1603555 RepID=A0A3G1B4W4_9ARCH|nr:threonine-phosphate decarboxylase CobD [Candidatus Nitrosotenuis cloacae]AJZ75788.1 aminotransferase class I/II [Candidatus Nitrosotenuis cloacae]